MRLKRQVFGEFPHIPRSRLIVTTFLLSISLLFVLGVWVVERQLQGPITQWAKTRAVNIATEAINSAVENSLVAQAERPLVKPLTGEIGNLTGISYNLPELQRIKTEIAQSVLAELDGLAVQETPVPLGTLTGFMPVAASGPSIRVRIVPVGSVATDMRFDFLSAGINQVLHRIYVDVKVSMRVIAPFLGSEFEIHEQVPVTTELIQGDVPSTYINWGGSLEELDKSVTPFAPYVPLYPSD